MLRILAEAGKCDTIEKTNESPGAAHLRKERTTHRKASAYRRTRVAPLSSRRRTPRCNHLCPGCKGSPMRFFNSKTFAEVAMEYLREQAVYGDKRKTAYHNVQILNRHLAHLPITEVTPSVIKRMFSDRLLHVSEATTNRQRATLSVIMAQAIDDGDHPGPNPVKLVPKFRESPGRTPYLTPDEARRLLKHSPSHLKNVINVALMTGGRLGEILKLTWGDVDLVHGLVTFRKETTKSRKERYVPMTSTLEMVFRGMRPGASTDRVFTYNGRSIKTVRSAFCRARELAGLPKFRFHDLRHAFSTYFVENGGDLLRLQEILGHCTPMLTKRYAHISPDHLRAATRFIRMPSAPEKSDAREH